MSLLSIKLPRDPSIKHDGNMHGYKHATSNTERPVDWAALTKRLILTLNLIVAANSVYGTQRRHQQPNDITKHRN